MISALPPKPAGLGEHAGIGAQISDALMSNPTGVLRAWRDKGELAQVFPELDALFGVPQSADEPAEVDVGEHVLRLVDLLAAAGAGLPLRWAGLLHKLGKALSPREFLPAHLGHEQRGAPLIEAACDRYGLDGKTRDLALLALHFCDKVHRAVDMRAAAIVGLLERADAMRQPQRFENLLTLCSCDYAAYPGRMAAEYSKADRLRRAAAACARADRAAASGEADAEQRTWAVAEALNSGCWALD